jgi:hypothetical protein
MQHEQPIYTSRPTAKSIWQAYRLYPDRLVLDMHLFGPVTVPLGEIRAVAQRPAGVVFDLARGDLGFKELMRTVKFDFADLHEHVSISKDTGFWRQFRITPEDPAEFVRAVEAARARLRAGGGTAGGGKA